VKIGMVVNSIDTELDDYTTTHLAIAATNLGHEVWYMGVADFAYGPDENAHARARLVPKRHYRTGHAYLAELRGKQATVQRITLDELDVLLLRNDPAEDVIKRPWARLAGINFARLAMRHGVIAVNDPDGLAKAANKMYLQYFPEEARPRTLISRDRREIKAFIKEQEGYAVLKPLSGSGGHNVFLIRPADGANINQMIDAVSADGYVIVQEYLKEAVKGDIRLFLMNGEPLQCEGKYALFRRVREEGDEDIRSNMTAGAISRPAEMNDKILRLAELVGPKLKNDGMFLVGLDIVGDKLMEINVFSPGGLDSAEHFNGVSYSREIIHAMERKVDYLGLYPGQIESREIAVL
jgi:glutathione synthase